MCTCCSYAASTAMMQSSWKDKFQVWQHNLEDLAALSIGPCNQLQQPCINKL